ncbi:MAG: hypothetical protein IBX47_09575 [Desulfuromonadales bacterium]|nr:hypothetical protein [Desulfuromonadales bacterium]
MIQLIEAPPRSGKSYFGVNYLVGFTKYDALYSEYVLDKNVLIISNIEGLKIKHWALTHCLNIDPLAKLSTALPARVKEFFSIANFENIKKTTSKNHIILMIDEVHELFPSGFKDQSIYDFFAFHGHLGIDVFFMTQGIDSMSRMFNPLLEYIVKATPRSKKISSTFSYRFCDLKGKYLYSKVIRSKQHVFNAYQSFRQDEYNKPKSAVMITAILVIVVFVAAVSLFNIAFGKVKSKGKNAALNSREDLVSKLSPAVDLDGLIQGTESKVITSFLPEKKRWSVVQVNAFYSYNGDNFYLIDGKEYRADSSNFRRFNYDTLSVEFYVIRQETNEPRPRGEVGTQPDPVERMREGEPIGEPAKPV